MNGRVDREPSRLLEAASALTAERLRVRKLVEQLRISVTGMLADAEQRVVELWTQRASTLDPQADPAVSIVIPVFNNLEATLRCLQSVAENWFDGLGVQVIVVDDGSTDRTSNVLSRIPGISYVRRSQSEGFAAACNQGAQAARASFICFLGQDTTVTEGWLEHLVGAAQAQGIVGAVGAKILSAEGALSEAGAIVWRDGTLESYGGDGQADDPRYNYRREVDYCSWACLLVRRDLFERLGGFDVGYASALYEGADLCLAMRSLNYRIAYEPRSCVVRHAGTDPSAEHSNEERLEINRAKFSEKWSQMLAGNFEYDPARIHRAALARNGGETLLIIDARVPAYDRDARSKRLTALMKLMRRARYNVIFLPDDYQAPVPYTQELQALGIEVLHQTQNGPPLSDALKAALPSLDAAWICSRNLMERYAPIVRINRATRIVYDTAQDRYESSGELQAMPDADAVVSTCVVPQVHDPAPKRSRFTAAKGVLFIGNYRAHANVDAAKWLCTSIMPLVWEHLPHVTLTLLGDAPPDTLLALASERVKIPGYIQDVAPLFRKSKIFAAPLRDARGMRGKIGHALAHGLPVVGTPVAIEGYDMAHERDCLIAGDAAGFAAAIVRLHTEELTWRRISTLSQKILKPFTTESVYPMLTCAIREVLHAHGGAAPVTV